MSTETIPAPTTTTASKRRVPRYGLSVPLHLTVLRSGVPDNIPGRAREIGEGGMGVVVASRLLLGESVRVEFLLPHLTTPVRATAVVRHQREQCFGLQFLRLPEEQQSIIRYWTRREADIVLVAQKPPAAQAAAILAAAEAESTPYPDLESSENLKHRPRIRHIVVSAVLVFVIAAMLGWWRWQQGWKELEEQVSPEETAIVEPQLQVPADVMQQRIRYQVMPEYPEGARLAGVQGTVVLDAIVSVEGAVIRVKVVSGPEALAVAASDAVRWWRYEPYLVHGQPATVKTTVALEFRLPNDR